MCKKISFFILFALIIANCSIAQTTIVLQPHFINGDEATLFSLDSTSPYWAGHPFQYVSDSNFFGFPEFSYLAVTNSSCPAWTRHLIRFRGITDSSIIPTGATIISATLHLYGIPSSPEGNYGNSEYPGSPWNVYGPNNGWVYELADSFDTHTVTWNTQPALKHSDSVFIYPSSSRWNEDDSLDVTNMIIDMFHHGNTGFMLRLQNETVYNERMFGSCYFSDSTKHPSLTVQYKLPLIGLGINKEDAANISFNLFPNPALDFLNIKAYADKAAEVAINVFDVTGRVMFSTRQQLSPGINSLSIPVSTFARGVYVLEMSSGEGTTRKRFVKEE